MAMLQAFFSLSNAYSYGLFSSSESLFQSMLEMETSSFWASSGYSLLILSRLALLNLKQPERGYFGFQGWFFFFSFFFSSCSFFGSRSSTTLTLTGSSRFCFSPSGCLGRSYFYFFFSFFSSICGALGASCFQCFFCLLLLMKSPVIWWICWKALRRTSETWKIYIDRGVLLLFIWFDSCGRLLNKIYLVTNQLAYLFLGQTNFNICSGLHLPAHIVIHLQATSDQMSAIPQMHSESKYLCS